MKKKLFFSMLVLCLIGIASAQAPLTGCPKILYTSAGLTDTVCDRTIKKIGTGFSNNIKVKLLNKEEIYIPKDSIWGIRQKNEKPLRFYKGRNYSVNQLSPLVQYSRHVGKSSYYYFSTTADAPIYSFTKDQLRLHADSATYAAIAEKARTGRHEISIDVYALYTRMANNPLWGGWFDIKYYPKKRWSTGLTLSGAGKNIRDTFTYSIARPLLIYLEAGWINQYDVVQKERFRLGINLTNGFAMAELRDKAQQVKVHTRYGDKNEAKKIAANYYYLLQPGMNVSYKLISNNHNPAFFITAKASYAFAFGKSNFSSQEAFSGYRFSLGFSLIGFDREQF